MPGFLLPEFYPDLKKDSSTRYQIRRVLAFHSFPTVTRTRLFFILLFTIVIAGIILHNFYKHRRNDYSAEFLPLLVQKESSIIRTIVTIGIIFHSWYTKYVFTFLTIVATDNGFTISGIVGLESRTAASFLPTESHRELK